MASPAHPSFISSLSRVRAARIVAAIGLLGPVATAQAVTIQIDSFTLTPGAGYGVDSGRNGENGGNLLDVLFKPNFSSRSIALEDPGDSLTFDVGFVRLREPDDGNGGNAGIRATHEQDGLGADASFSLGGSLGTRVNLTADGSAFEGLIADDAVDYALTWNPLVVDLDGDGLLKIELLDLAFSKREMEPLQARFTLLDPPQPRSVAPVPGAVPEPGTLAIFALGLAGLGTLRRARRAG